MIHLDRPTLALCSATADTTSLRLIRLQTTTSASAPTLTVS